MKPPMANLDTIIILYSTIIEIYKSSWIVCTSIIMESECQFQTQNKQLCPEWKVYNLPIWAIDKVNQISKAFQVLKNTAYLRHWITQCVRIVALRQTNPKIEDLFSFFHMSCVWFHMSGVSCVTCSRFLQESEWTRKQIFKIPYTFRC